MLSTSRRTPQQPRTFTHQHTLPRLPIPDLSQSVAKYLKCLRPVLAIEAKRARQPDAERWVYSELSKREELAADFLKAGGLGRKLQQRLIDVDRSSPYNWLDDNYWTTVVYHSCRTPLPINSNWWVLCAADPDVPKSITNSRPARGDFTSWQVRRAAVMTWRLLDFQQRLNREELIPDTSRAGPFCMHQYTRVFGYTRIPDTPNDRTKAGKHPDPSRNVTVIVSNQIYILQVRDEKGSPHSKDAIEAALWSIIEQTRTNPHEAAIGALTSADRQTWADARSHLCLLDNKNRDNLTAIEDSLFAVSLDDWTRVHPSAHPSSIVSELAGRSRTTDLTEASPSLDLDSHILTASAGNKGHNRWFDKSLNISVESNSRASVLGEHSACDALIPSILIDYMLAEGMGKPQGLLSESEDDEDVNTASNDVTSAPSKHIKRLSWTTDEAVHKAIDQAEQTAALIIEDSDALMLWYDEYGTDWISKEGRLSPDAYIQMAMQLAYTRLHGEHTPVYETASTRLFMHGRTDTIRSLTTESQAWVDAVISKKCSSIELYHSLKRAISVHNDMTREASTGKAFDRHFLGLRMNLRNGESHPLFADELFQKCQQYRLSTSGLSAGDRFYGTGFGSPEPDGYGINYLAAPELIKFGIESKWSSRKSSTHRLRLALIQALRDMRKMCEEGLPPTSDATREGAKL